MMYQSSKASLTTALLVCLLSVPQLCLGAVTGSAEQQARIESIELKQQRVLRELEFTKVKHTEAQRKLDDARRELAARQNQLKITESRLGDQISDAEADLLKNEKQRLAVAELSLQSQLAAIERLERKQAELTEAFSSTQKEIDAVKSSITKATNAASVQATRHAAVSQQELITLKSENDELKAALESDRRRLATAELRIEELVRIADFRLQQIEQLEAEVTTLTQPQSTGTKSPVVVNSSLSRAPLAKNLDLSFTVLEGEGPIAQDEDGERIVIRSHSIDDNVVMTQIGPKLYQAELTVDPGKAYFDLRRRRYRGVFPENYQGHYRFIYDLSIEETPKLYVELPNKENQMITNSIEDF